MFKKIKAALSASLIISLLTTLANKTADAIAHSVFGSIFLKNDENEEKRENSVILGKRERKKGKFRLFALKQFEGSGAIKFVKYIFGFMLSARMKFYGILFLSYGVYSVITYFVKAYLLNEKDTLHLITGIGISALAVLCFFSKKKFCEELCESRIIGKFVFSFLGIRRELVENAPDYDSKSVIAFFIGSIFGVMTYFIHPLYLLIGFFGVIAAYMIMARPQTGIYLMLFSTPFLGILPHPSILMMALVLYVAFATAVKVLLGKRVLHFEITDFLILAFLVFMAAGGIISVDGASSLSYAGMYCVLSLGYFLVVTLIKSKEQLRSCVYSILTSAFLVSIYGIYQNFFGNASTVWTDTEMFGSSSARITSTFENPNVLAEYLIMCLPFAFALFIEKKGFGKKLVTAVSGVAIILALVYTMSRGAWLGCIIGLLIFMLIYSRKTLVVCFFGLFCIPFLPIVLPDSIIKRFTSIGNMADSSTAYRVHIWQGCIELFKDFWASGIGVGKDVFAKIYPTYTLAGIESAPHSHNLFLQIAIELGIFGLIIFILAMLSLASQAFTYFSKCRKDGKSQNGKSNRLTVAAALCGVIAVAAQGMTDYVWYNYRIYLMFWLLAGLCAAGVRSERGLMTGDYYDGE